MSLESLKEAREQIKQAEKVLREEAKTTIQEELKALFADPEVKNVTWAQKAGEYNDEGMYPGVFGPGLNLIDESEGEVDLSDWVYDGSYDLLYGNMRIDPRAQRLNEVLNAIGEDILSGLFGDENVTVAERTKDGARLVSEYAGC